MSGGSVVDTIKRIEGIAQANDRIIREINSMIGKVDLVAYVIQRQETGYYVVNENTNCIETQMIVSEWQDVIELIPLRIHFRIKSITVVIIIKIWCA